MKFIILLICSLSINKALCDVPSLILCLGEFTTIEGVKKSYYFNISSEGIYADGNFELKGKILNMDKRQFESTEIFTKFYELNCGKKHLYGIDKKDLIPISNLSLKTVKIKYVVCNTWSSYIGVLKDELLEKIKMGSCNCVNFDIDFKYQEYGCSTGESYFFISNFQKSYIKKNISRIKETYKKLNLHNSKDTYSINHDKFRHFISNEVKGISNDDLLFMVHYI